MRSALSIKILTIAILILTGFLVKAQDVLKFEYISSKDGLSQNTVFSILADKKGFLWIGTMNGLNRYDGKNFKIYKSQSNSSEMLTNNRISRLWQDDNDFIWIQSYDGFYHLFNQQKETFQTLPSYTDNIEERNSTATSFCQYDPNTIFVGSTASGVFMLQYNKETNEYATRQFVSRGKESITNNHILNIYKDENKNLWILTQKGLNFLSATDIAQNSFSNIQHFHVAISFTNAVAENEDYVLFGSQNHGVVTYHKATQTFKIRSSENTPFITDNHITHIINTGQKQILIGIKNHAPILANSTLTEYSTISVHCKNLFDVYIDRFNQAWLTGTNLGITRLNLKTHETKFFELTPQNLQSITDHERHFFYEDIHNQLWIGLHGSGLAAYNRDHDSFVFHRNNVNNNNTIPSNIVHCIAEDLSGQLWLGTGQYMGGLVKVIAANPAFKHITPVEKTEYITENVVRYLFEDNQQNIWIATKGGKIHLYDINGKPTGILNDIKIDQGKPIRPNVYSIIIDKDGYLWMGTKGNGLLQSKRPLKQYQNNLQNIEFINHTHQNANNQSLTHNNVYSLTEDEWGHIWVATFGGGLSRITKNGDNTLSFTNITKENSNLSSNQTRFIQMDSKGNLWIATTFGVNLLNRSQLNNNDFKFRHFLHSANEKSSLSYNDVYHIYEDSNHELWFGTSGGGLNHLIKFTDSEAGFECFTTTNGLSSDVVYSIHEDAFHNLWIGTENGISRKSKNKLHFETFNQNNGTPIQNFSEAAICQLSNGKILLGGNTGFLCITPQNLQNNDFQAHLELTNFLLFNKDVQIDAEQSPLNKTIAYTDQIKLRHNQSSIAIEYISLDLLDPDQIQYAYILEGLEKEWNYVGNQRKAIYTNLMPGTYTFRLKCTTRGGEWNTQERTLTIKITPPWYLTVPAFIGYAILLGFIITLITRTITRIQQYRTELSVEKKVNEMKLQFFTNISHEIRTPLTLIIGPLQDILNQELPVKVTQQLRIIKQNASRMLLLTNQILDFRKIQNNKMTLNITEVDAIKFTQPVYECFQLLARHKHINYTLATPEQMEKIWVDAAKLDIIIYNLLSNAMKFTSEKKAIELILTQDNTHTYFIVRDQGPGIAPDALPELFTRYTILSNGQFAGTGIGLSLSYELAKLHGGELLVESALNEGTTFTLKLPNGNKHLKNNPMIRFASESPILHDSELPQPVVEENQQPQPTETAEFKKILVVEDNPEIQKYICQSLQHKYHCLKASNGQEGLILAQKENPAIIITDLMMPVMDGLTMIKKIKNDFNISHIPVVAVTAKATLQDEIEGIETGADAYIQKPFNTTHLLATINNLVKQREQLLERITHSKPVNPAPSVQITSKDEEFLGQLVQFIEKNYKTDFNIDAIAEEFAVSRTVFYNKVKGLTSMSPLEFVRQIKLQIAEQLLSKGYNVSEVAFEVGYSDVKYFSRQFKAQFGKAPSQIKRESHPGKNQEEDTNEE
ncbi:MAG: hybrid sensor histidine kinase/response regulator transcription factor [Breznakibacter sp.]